jgi:putative endonuclease
MVQSTRKIGKQIEDIACAYLQKQGLELLQTNYQCRLGEIDLILQHGEFIVFTEVRYRQDNDYGGALESITKKKQQHIIRTATYYLVERNIYEKTPSRFDVVAVSSGQNEPIIEWIPSAFTAL